MEDVDQTTVEENGTATGEAQTEEEPDLVLFAEIGDFDEVNLTTCLLDLQWPTHLFPNARRH